MGKMTSEEHVRRACQLAERYDAAISDHAYLYEVNSTDRFILDLADLHLQLAFAKWKM